jgi:hypothetical protein
MKLPSLHYLGQNARQSFLRFPLSIVSAFIAVCIGIYLNENHQDIANSFPFINAMLCLALGIPLFFCVAVFTSNKGYSKRAKLLLDLSAILLLVLIYFTLPNIQSTQNTSLPYIRYAIYNIIIHLLVAFVPYAGKGQLNGFWHYNKILFVRFLTSLLYSAALYAGLALALGSLDFLFEMEVHNKLYFDLFIFIAGFFNTWFFVSGIPARFDTLDAITEYPKGIKIFSQYILLPLLILYLLILYVYASKIVLLWSWPKGLVSYLIACVAVLGILTLLLIHPYGALPGNSWIKKFSRIYYFILAPLVALLFIAIGMRISDYGITINRYIIVLLGVWLTIVCFYFAIGKLNIKFIPVSLAVILMLTSFGYWGMFAVSERSQVARLNTILVQQKILQEGKIQNEVIWRKDSLPAFYAVQEENTNEEFLLNDSLHNEVKSILDYLDDHHGFASIRPWFSQDIDSILRINNETKADYQWLNEAQTYMKSMGLKYVHKYDMKDSYFTYTSTSSHRYLLDVRDYDYVVTFANSYYKNDTLQVEGIPYLLNVPTEDHQKLSLISDKDTLEFDTDQLIKRLIARYGEHYANVPEKEMTLSGNSDRFDAKLELHTISVHSENDSVKINSITGNIFIRLRKLP